MEIESKKEIDTPKLSIGLPVYNGENYLHNSIDSLLNQSFTNFELIISDNASTDATEDICTQYIKKDKRIRYIRQKNNLGATQNFYFVLQKLGLLILCGLQQMMCGNQLLLKRTYIF